MLGNDQTFNIVLISKKIVSIRSASHSRRSRFWSIQYTGGVTECSTTLITDCRP